MIKKVLVIVTTILICSSMAFTQSRSGSNLAIEGFKFEKRIKGPKHKNSKIIEVMVDDNDYYVVVAYKGPKSFLTLIIYELYTWNVAGTYKFKSRAELYNSYFSEDGAFFYLNTDIYKQIFTEINIKTGEMKILKCNETPKGCNFIEPQKYVTNGYTIGNNYYFMMDENRKNDLKIYVNKDMIFANSYLETEEETPEETKIDTVVEEKQEPKTIEEIELFITEPEIESLKKGEIIEKQNVKILLQTDQNKNLIDKIENNYRYVLLSLIDLSKISFGNRIVKNHVKVYLKN
ncbi:MAG: hypothetical protein GXO79_07435 [Chlorobi bacterium]|nr:hypothetical protein [Chlorobiota bacterium]